MGKSPFIPEEKRGRGRPVAKWLTLEELAARLDLHEGALLHYLETMGDMAFPGAVKEVTGWQVPESAMTRILGSARPFFSIQEFARLFRVSPFTVSRRCSDKTIKIVQIPELGVQRIPWSEYERLKGGLKQGVKS